MGNDPDQIQALYATPHRWTPFALQEAKHRVVQTDLSRWDYKHQVLESTQVPNWRVVLWVKLIEAVCQLRPKSLIRLLAHPDRGFRAGMFWYSNIGRRVWLYEIWQWLFFDRRTRNGPVLADFLNGAWKRELAGVPSHPAAPAAKATNTLPSSGQVPADLLSLPYMARASSSASPATEKPIQSRDGSATFNTCHS